MGPFEHDTPTRRVVFGAGVRHVVPDEVDRLDAHRVVVVTGGSAEPAGREIAGALGGRVVDVLTELRQHVPRDLADRATQQARGAAADALVTVGGGSATGLAKAMAVALDLPIVAIPTTYAGSEMTPTWAVTDDRKHTARDDRARPAVVLYDPELTVGLPPRVSAASGMNAIAQAVAVFVHDPPDPVAALYATEAVRRLADALPRVVDRPDDLAARSDALYGSFLAGYALATTGGSAHHRLVHRLSGGRGLVHADVHAVLLPHTTAVLQADDPDAFAPLVEVLGGDVGTALHDLAVRIGAPTTLAAAGVSEEAATQALDELGREDTGDTDPLRELLKRAAVGDPPIAVTDGTGRNRS